MGRHIVARVDEIPPGGRKIVEVEGRSIGVFNVGGELFAIRNRCPHQGGPLCLGPIVGRLESSGPGDYRLTSPADHIRCPWHGWEFDLRTGASWFDPEHTRVKRYPVAVEADGGGSGPGPYTAETYPVALERRSVVVIVDP